MVSDKPDSSPPRRSDRPISYISVEEEERVLSAVRGLPTLLSEVQNLEELYSLRDQVIALKARIRQLEIRDDAATHYIIFTKSVRETPHRAESSNAIPSIYVSVTENGCWTVTDPTGAQKMFMGKAESLTVAFDLAESL